MQSRTRREESAEDAALRFVQQHAAELLRFARRFSHSPDDAHDAYQRAVEILVRRLRVDPPTQLLPWVRTVIRHEALAVRREREQLLGRVEIDLDRHEDRATEDPVERVVGHERLRQTAEALQRLKPQEVTALVLRAQGLSYAEICTRTGWTYTRTNRAVTEGRRALLERLGAIESGAECARWLPLLSALADGEASAEDLAAVRPHLRSCPACRATLRAVHAAPGHVALLVPPAVVAISGAGGGGLAGHAEATLHALLDRMTLLAARVQGAAEALPGAKLAAVAASTAAIAGGGVVLEQATQGRPAPAAAVGSSSAGAAPGSVGGLTAIAFPRPRSGASARREQRSAGPPGGEFAGTPAAPPEFTPPTTPRAEFAATETPAAPSAPATVASSSPPAEFGSP